MNSYLTFVALGAFPLAYLLVLTVFGFGGNAAKEDLEGASEQDTDVRWTYKFLTVIALPSAGVVGFGLGGFMATKQGWANPDLAGIVGAALVMGPVPLLYLIGQRPASPLARFMGRDGTVSEAIPAGYAGTGAIVIALPSGTVDVPAVTAGVAIPAGAHVVVRGLFNRNIVEVDAMDQMLLQGLPPK